MNKNRLLVVVQTVMVCTGLGVASFPKWSDSQFPNEGQKIQNTIPHRCPESQNTKTGMEMII